MQKRVISLATDSLQTLALIAEHQADEVAALAERMVDALMRDQRIFCCGNGASGANALSFASKLGNRYQHERPAFPVIMLGQESPVLTAIAADIGLDEVFSRPLQALARPGDLLLALSASGHPANVCNAVGAMQQAGGQVLALSGTDDSRLADLIRPDDLHLRLPGNCAARIHEAQLFVLNCCCDLIDKAFFGADDA